MPIRIKAELILTIGIIEPMFSLGHATDPTNIAFAAFILVFEQGASLDSFNLWFERHY